MPSKEEICVVQDSLTDGFCPVKDCELEAIVDAIKHNLHFGKSKSSHSVYSKHRRMTPYVAPRSVCRNKLNNSEIATEHSSPNCKYCLFRSKTSKDSVQDPYEILNTFLKKGILINEAVKRLQESKRPKKTNYYDLEENDISVESV